MYGVAVRSKAYVCSSSLAGIACSNVVCYQVAFCVTGQSLVRWSHIEFGVC